MEIQVEICYIFSSYQLFMSQNYSTFFSHFLLLYILSDIDPGRLSLLCECWYEDGLSHLFSNFIPFSLHNTSKHHVPLDKWLDNFSTPKGCKHFFIDCNFLGFFSDIFTFLLLTLIVISVCFKNSPETWRVLKKYFLFSIKSLSW